jgi:hypothetical protein
LNRDGWPDVVAGIANDWGAETVEPGPSIEIFLNQGPR